MDELEELANRARTGDPFAAEEFQRRLEKSLAIVVRRTLRWRVANSPLTRRILTEADQLDSPGWVRSRENRHWLIQCIAQRICDAYIDGLGIAVPEVKRMRETVCN